MAALQTLRNRPALLMSVIGGALLLFIVTLTDLNSCARPDVEAEVCGKELKYNDFEQQVHNEELFQQLLLETITDDAKDQIREQVWERFEQSTVVGKQADKLGLVCSKKEVQNELSSVTPQRLQQIMQGLQYGQVQPSQISAAEKIMLLMGKYMGQASADAYKQFMKTADTQMAQAQKANQTQAVELIANLKAVCLYCEQQIAEEVRTQKYMALTVLGASSNPVSAKMDFEQQNTSFDVEMAQIPYSTVDDKSIKVTDDDLKAKYESLKELFRIPSETRDMKMINITVTPSQKDQEKTMAEVKAAEDTLRQLSSAEAIEQAMRGINSDVAYNNVYIPKSAYQTENMNDIVAVLDSLKVGETMATKIEATDRSGQQYVSTYKLIAAKTTPDSMQICQFAVDKQATADSIVAAVKAGKTLSALAADSKYAALTQKYGLKGDTVWAPTKYYVDPKKEKNDSTASAYTDICQMPVGTVSYYSVPDQQGNKVYVVTYVLDAKAPSEKYNLAIVKKPLKFSNETFNEKRQALIAFLAQNKTIESIEKNASKAGYTVIDRPNISTTDAMTLRYSIGGEGAKQAFIWAFDDAEAGNVSNLFICGRNSEKLLVIAVSAINDGKYLAWDNPSVKAQLEALVKQDKKAEKILASVKNVKNISGAKAVKGAETNALPELPLAQVASYEPTFAGALERTKNGAFTGAVKGTQAIYMAQVNSRKVNGTFNQATAMMQSAQTMIQELFNRQGNIIDAMVKKAKIVDKRYKF